MSKALYSSTSVGETKAAYPSALMQHVSSCCSFLITHLLLLLSHILSAKNFCFPFVNPLPEAVVKECCHSRICITTPVPCFWSQTLEDCLVRTHPLSAVWSCDRPSHVESWPLQTAWQTAGWSPVPRVCISHHTVRAQRNISSHFSPSFCREFEQTCPNLQLWQ